MRNHSLLWISLFAAGCGFGGGDAQDDGSHAVSGKAVDVHTGAEVEVASLSVSGLTGTSEPALAGSTFSIDGIPEGSSFQLLAAAPPLYRSTFSQTITVDDSDLDELSIPLVSESLLADLSTSFAIAPSPERGILLARVLGEDGTPRAGISATSFLLEASGASTPKFLSDAMLAAPSAVATTTSGWVVFFDVPPGVVSLTQSAISTVILEMATAPIEAATVTVAEIRARDGAPSMLRDVSFGRQIVPIFAARGCTACHSKGKSGDKIGGLNLTGPADKIYKELKEDPTRVVVAMPEQSLILTKPSRESPSDGHPNVSFASSADPDFQKLYVWIKEGAKEN